MKNAFTTLFLLAAVGLSAADQPAAKPEAGSRAETNRQTSWEFTPDPSLPNVLILGDSISIGYTLEVRKLLAGKANVFRPMSPDGKKAVNCSGTTAGVAQIDQFLGDRKWAVIHFNWGLHDLKHVTEAGTSKTSNLATDPTQATVEVYSANLETIVKRLEGTGAKLIFATTTPVAQGSTNPLREVDAPARYNAAAVKIMKAHGIAVNDLFGFCEPQLAKLQLPKNVHFTPAGSQALATQVATAIEGRLGGGK